jgi:hypothetical protein
MSSISDVYIYTYTSMLVFLVAMTLSTILPKQKKSIYTEISWYNLTWQRNACMQTYNITIRSSVHHYQKHDLIWYWSTIPCTIYHLPIPWWWWKSPVIYTTMFKKCFLNLYGTSTAVHKHISPLLYLNSYPRQHTRGRIRPKWTNLDRIWTNLRDTIQHGWYPFMRLSSTTILDHRDQTIAIDSKVIRKDTLNPSRDSDSHIGRIWKWFIHRDSLEIYLCDGMNRR